MRSTGSSRRDCSRPRPSPTPSSCARSGRLIGLTTFSDLDPDNGCVLFHISIGEHDAWDRGYGTEATELMLELAFERIGLHRVGLSVFSFNERARSGRTRRPASATRAACARRSARDGRRWDELHDGHPAATSGAPGPLGPRPADGEHRRGRRPGARTDVRELIGAARAMPWTTPERSSRGSTRPSPMARCSGRRSSIRRSSDLEVALEQDDGQKLGGKSAEASRFILRAIDHGLDEA